MRIVLKLFAGVLLAGGGLVVGILLAAGVSWLANEAIFAAPGPDARLTPVDGSRGNDVAAYEVRQGWTVWRVACRGACDPIVSHLGWPVWRVRAVDGKGRIIRDRDPLGRGGATWRRSEGSSLVLWEKRP